MKKERPDNWKRYHLRFLAALGMTIRSQAGKGRERAGNMAGSVLVAVLGISMILMLAGVTMVVLSRQSMHRIHRTAHNAQAQAVAEAGIADMVAKLGANYTLWQNNTNAAAFFTNGAYYVTTELQTNGNVLITSDGIYMAASNRTIMELLGTVQTHWNELYNTNSAVMSDGDVRFFHRRLDDGRRYSRQPGCRGIPQRPERDDERQCLGRRHGRRLESHPPGTNNPGAPPETVPPTGPFNFDSYRQLATNDGVYLEGDQTLSGKPITNSANGILYVNGDLTIQNQSSFTGTIVVAGDVDIGNRFTQTNDPSCYDPVSSICLPC